MTQHVQSLDGNGIAIGLPPQEVETIAADTAIDWKAIRPEAEVDIYFSGGDEIPFTISAGDIVVVHTNMRLSSEMVCLVF